MTSGGLPSGIEQIEAQHSGLGHHRRRGRSVRRQPEASVADEQGRGGAMVDHRHVAPRAVDVGAGDGVGDGALGIEDEQAALALGGGGAVVARQAADDHPAGLQHRHRRGQADPAGALRQVPRNLREQRQVLRGRVVVDDGGAEALQVVLVVEIVDQHVVLGDLAGGDRCDHEGIGILVAVVGNGGCQGRMVMDGLEKSATLGGDGIADSERRRQSLAPSPRYDLHVSTPADASSTRSVPFNFRDSPVQLYAIANELQY